MPDRNKRAPEWWRTAVVYEVYPRSFASSGDRSEGTIDGLRRRLRHIADLGVDALWIAPWYPSPRADGGYDVTDYCGIDPRFGTLADADALLTEAHASGLRVIIDLVANHTSEQHPWFTAALADPNAPERGHYVFRDGRGPDGALPPNNWISAFGGVAWTRTTDPDGTPGQWYLHTFAPEQPDVDWTNDAVRTEFDRILRFWLDRGVDGLRVDAAPAMAKAPGLPDADYSGYPGFASTQWTDNPHWDVPAVHEITRRWRTITDAYPGDRVLVGEAFVSSPERLSRYVAPGHLHTTFNFDFLRTAWDAAALRSTIDATLAAHSAVGAPPTWVLSSHDAARHVTRLGRQDTGPEVPVGAVPTDLALGTRRARAALLLMLALPGSAYLYQGEELGLPEVEDLADADLQDPVWTRSGGTSRGRDGCRVPLPWEGDRPPFGFSEGRPWLPQPAGWAALTAQQQAADPTSMLCLYREALALRRRLPDLGGTRLDWLAAADGVLDFVRDGVRCIVNLSRNPVELDHGSRVLLASAPLDHAVPPDGAAWVSAR
ncbi:glycoside hydrolase family 13 protein [Xylanimonas cellulosilytica]|nr:alpha-amylase family glycosyl hydrolase [Xylanimonas cellulosilytica]